MTSSECFNIGPNLKEQLYTEQKGLCKYCGRRLFNGYTVEHIFPRAIYKWTYSVCSEEERLALKEFMKSKDNTCLVHASCNVKAGLRNIDGSRSNKDCNEFIQPYIEKYKAVMQPILERQDYECYLCGNELKEGKMYPRRVFHEQPRTSDNGVIVCKACNDFYSTGGCMKQIIHLTRRKRGEEL